MLKDDAMDNQDIYAYSWLNHGGFDGSTVVDADIYTEINNDFGNTNCDSHNPIQERADDLMGDYISTLKLDQDKKGSFTRENEKWAAEHIHKCNYGYEHFVS